jgi:hypothetical protein
VVKKLLYILAILLFVLNYQICDYFYYNEEIKDIKKWWDLKSNIYAVIMVFIFYGSILGSKGQLRFILSLGLGFCVSNVIDKVFFNVLEFRYNDTLMIILTICASLLDYLQNGKQNK